MAAGILRCSLDAATPAGVVVRGFPDAAEAGAAGGTVSAEFRISEVAAGHHAGKALCDAGVGVVRVIAEDPLAAEVGAELTRRAALPVAGGVAGDLADAPVAERLDVFADFAAGAAIVTAGDATAPPLAGIGGLCR